MVYAKAYRNRIKPIKRVLEGVSMINQNNTLFISDLHLGHKSICKYRPNFATVEEHDETIKDTLLSIANKRQKFYILGDIAFTSDAGNWIVELSEKCNLEIVLGNHDTREGGMNVIKYAKAGIKMHGLTTYKDAWLSHCPIHYQELRNKAVNIHGHTHNHNITAEILDGLHAHDLRYFNVSCENIDYKPIRYDEIMERVL